MEKRLEREGTEEVQRGQSVLWFGVPRRDWRWVRRSPSPSVVAQLFCLFICGVEEGRAKEGRGRGSAAEGVSVSVSVAVDLRNSA